MRRFSAFICIVILVGAAAGVVALQPLHGPILLTLSSTHGVDTGDLIAFPLVLAAIALARARVAGREQRSAASTRRRVEPLSAIALGALLLLASAGARHGGPFIDARPGGPLVPAGGGTLDGTIHQTFATSPVPVDRWSHIALTYDGAMERLFVNGRQVSGRRTTGTIQTPGNPMWIGGNRPYGEHFDGLIDDVRVYGRALSPLEIRRDMATPVTAAPGLVAGYAFDAGSGDTAKDASGEGNTGDIRGATWARGRHGHALRFDGRTTVVRVPASSSLNVTRAMTLSGWIHPNAHQMGWRTIVQRQTDAFFLTAGSGHQNPRGWTDAIRAPLVLAAAVWFCLVIASGHGPWSAARRRSWWMPVALFMLGSLIDAALAPSGALTGPTLVALWLAATSSTDVERAAFRLAGAVCVGLTAASLARIAGVDAVLSVDDGGVARAVALGALVLVAGLAWYAAPGRRATRP